MIASNASAGARRPPVVLVSREISYIFPLSYAYLAGALRQQGHAVVVLFRPTAESDWPRFVRRIMSLDPLLVGFGSLYPELKAIAAIVRMLNDAGRTFPVVVGGQMVTPTPEFAVTITGADYGVLGEGEITLCRLAAAVRDKGDVHAVPGLAIREPGGVRLTGEPDIISDLSKLPPIPYDLFPVSEWLRIGKWYSENGPQPHWHHRDRVISVHGGRGCPFSCNFCYHHSRPRYRTIDAMMADAAEGISRFDANVLYFSDDLVLTSPARARELIRGIGELGRRVGISVSTRCDILKRLDDGDLAGLAAAGCRVMGIGVESGSNRILDVIGKNTTAEDILAGIERLTRHGIVPTTCMMVGQLGETWEDVELSIRLMRETVRISPNIQYAFSIATPFPGSALYKTIFQRGLLKDDREFYDRYFASPGEWKQVVNVSAMTDRQVLDAYAALEKAYQTEKARVLDKRVARLVQHQMRLGRVNRLASRLILDNLPNCGVTRTVRRLSEATYDHMQVLLENSRLRLSGFPLEQPRRHAD